MNTDTKHSRIDYLDLVKGFAILWVVWWHTCHPPFVHPYYHVPIFFVISGIFFRKEPFSEFIKKKYRRILLPFLLFYGLSYLYRIAFYFWDFRTLRGFDWMMLFDIFKCAAPGDYLYVNAPLWFLFCLFVVYIFYWLLSQCPRWVSYLYIAAVMLLTNHIVTTPTPFFINDALRWTAYFALGNLFFKPLIDKLKKKSFAIILATCSLIVYLATYWISQHISFNTYTHSLVTNVLTISFISIVIPLFSLLDGTRFTQPLRFYGMKSLMVLGLHAPVLIFYQRIITKLYGGVNYWGGLANLTITILTIIPLIYLLEKLFPTIFPSKRG